MKEKILEFLKQQEGFISGQRICDELGVSRTAVWKYMNSLKKEGYEIESVTRKGYRLLQSPDLLTREAVLSCIKKGEIPGELCCFESIDSTNEEAKRRGEAGAPDGSIYVADNQTNGKGRRGRTWLSPSGEDIFFTILLRPDLPLNSVSMLTLVAASAVAEAVDKVTGQECQIKWPNDIMVNGRKLVGILTELSASMEKIDYIIMGIGINTGMERADFPEAFREGATSFRAEGVHVSRKTLLAAVLSELEKEYAVAETEGFARVLDNWRNLSCTLGQNVRVVLGTNSYTGKAVDIDKDGCLLVDTGNEVNRVIAGDVSIRPAE